MWNRLLLKHNKAVTKALRLDAHNKTLVLFMNFMLSIMTKYISTIFFSYFPEKSFHLLNQWESKEQLRLFRADLQEDGSFDEAVRGCDGVFHVAASMEFGVPASESAGNIFCIVS